MAGRHEQTDSAIKDRAEGKTQEPKLFNVILLNDDYTTMEFVLQILETLFQKSPAVSRARTWSSASLMRSRPPTPKAPPKIRPMTPKRVPTPFV